MTKKHTKKETAQIMTWKEAYSFCAAHVLVEKKCARWPQLHHVAIRMAAESTDVVIMAATSGKTAAFLELKIEWLTSVLPELPAQLKDDRWHFVDKDGVLFDLLTGASFPRTIRNVIPADLEHRPGYGPHLGYIVFEPIFCSMKAARFTGGEWYMYPEQRKNADGTLEEYGMEPALFKVQVERVDLLTAWILAMPSRSTGSKKAGHILEGL